MSGKKFIISWQPVLTDHQAFTYQALASNLNLSMRAYVSIIEDEVRKKQGWGDTSVTSIERLQIPSHGFLKYCYQQLLNTKQDIHFFASPFQQPRLIICMMLAAWLGVRFYLISEPYSPSREGYLSDSSRIVGSLKVFLRPAIYRIYALLFRKRLSGIFTISSLAYQQYKRAGIPANKLHPFGYFIPAVNLRSNSSLTKVGPIKDVGLRIIFIGSLIERKGIDLLQDAVLEMKSKGLDVKLDIYGPGNSEKVLVTDQAVRYCGQIPFGQSQEVIHQYHLLVLPSRYDGWGVVINEALCAGVPVVSSDKVGAGLVAKNFGAGLIFSSNNSSALSDVLTRLFKEPLLLENMRVATTIAASALQPEFAAQYMVDVISNHSTIKISDPWGSKQS